MATVALGVANDGETGTTPLAMRKIQSMQWSHTGVVDGLKVTGRQGASYNVAQGVAVLCRDSPAGGGVVSALSSADGFSIAYWEGGQTPTVSANPGSLPRLDAVWLKAGDVQLGDEDNLVHVGVTEGTPASSPTAPTAPPGTLLLAVMRLPGGAADTSGATAQTVVDRAVPKGASLGVLADRLDTSQRTVLGMKPYTFASAAVHLPTDRVLSITVMVSVQAVSPKNDARTGSGYAQCRIDGVRSNTFRFRCDTWSPSCYCYTYMVKLSKGDHVIEGWLHASMTAPASDVATKYAPNDWPGQRLTVVDMGPS